MTQAPYDHLMKDGTQFPRLAHLLPRSQIEKESCKNETWTVQILEILTGYLHTLYIL